jgi:hypothetical protein
LVEFFNKPILRKEFSFFNTSLRFQRLQSRAIAQGHLVRTNPQQGDAETRSY